MFRYITGFLLLWFMASCRPEVFPPKPPGYFRIDTPSQHKYQVFDKAGYPYTFEYPVYSDVQSDTVFLGEHARNPYWININIPGLNAVINITYKDISPRQPLSKLVVEAFNLSFFHHEKADYMTTQDFSNGRDVAAVLYIVGGNTASRYQFTATDSVKNFIRGALYFDVTPNADSLQPANDFLEKDIKHLLMTLRWKNNGQTVVNVSR